MLQNKIFLYNKLIPNISVNVKFSNNNPRLKFKDPSNLEFEFTITPTLVNPIRNN